MSLLHVFMRRANDIILFESRIMPRDKCAILLQTQTDVYQETQNVTYDHHCLLIVRRPNSVSTAAPTIHRV